MQGGGTENHLILINMKQSFGINGKMYEKALDLIGLTLNANALPGDTGGAFKPNGVRLGTPAITTRGLAEPEMKKIAEWMEKIALLCKKANQNGLEDIAASNAQEIARLREEVRTLALNFPLPAA